jgi:methionyl-tRNA formyltransferase
MTNETRIVFMGTPDFAVPSLRALAGRYDVVGVVTQPDRGAGRGRAVRQSAAKQAALDLGLPVFQPETLRDPEAVAHLRDWEPTAIVVAAFGQILRKEVLELPPRGCLNVHASLLPRWRGAAPIQYAIWAGDDETGVTIMLMDEGLDSGPILSQRATPIGSQETAASLHDTLADLGAELLLETLPGYLSGEVRPRPQPDEGVTLAPSLKKDAGRIDWTQRAVEIDRQVRAFDPWPGTHTLWGEERLKVLSGSPLTDKRSQALPGTVVSGGEGPAVTTGEGLYALERIQPPGGKPMPAQAYVNGRPDFVGARLT